MSDQRETASNTPTQPLDVHGAAITVGRVIDRATLTRFEVKIWRGRRAAPKVTEEYVNWLAVTTGEEVDPSRVGTEIRLIAAERVGEMENLRRHARLMWERESAPWLDDGRRVVLTGRLPDLANRIAAYERDTWLPAVDRFIADFPAMFAEARNKLGPLYDPSLFGDVRPDDLTNAKWRDRLRAAFTFRFQPEPFPNLADWRAEGLSPEDLERFRANVEASQREGFEQAQRAVFADLQAPIRHLAERLKGYTGGRKGSFQQATLDAIADVISRLPALNITGDARLDGFAALATELANLDLQGLRDDETYREQSGALAAEMVKALDDFV